jgi:hypothetical protein
VTNETIIEAMQRTATEQAGRDAQVIALLAAMLKQMQDEKKDK